MEQETAVCTVCGEEIYDYGQNVLQDGFICDGCNYYINEDEEPEELNFDC